MDSAFKVHMLNNLGKARANDIAKHFNVLLEALENIWISDGDNPLGGREQSIVRTKLEEACFFAKKAMAIQTRNQDRGLD